jgi:hypothetical protein
MTLVGTVLHGGFAHAVYSSNPAFDADVLRELVKPLAKDHAVVFGPSERLVQVDGEGAAPAVLPPDYSESVEGRADG